MKNQSIQSMQISDIQQLLKLQQLFHAKYLTQQLLTEMIRLYVQAVDNLNKPNSIKSYFMGKIQMVVSRPEVIHLLEKKQNDRQNSFQMKKNKDKKNTKQNKINQKINTELEIKERDLKIKMQFEIMKDVNQNLKKINQDVKQAEKKQQKKYIQINNQIQKQDNQLNLRLQRRKKLRKNSVNLEDIGNIDIIPVIKKEELIEAQKDLTQAVIRFTTRMTEKQSLKMEKREAQIGRIKIPQIKEETNAEEDYFNLQQSTSNPLKQNSRNQGKSQQQSSINSIQSTQMNQLLNPQQNSLNFKKNKLISQQQIQSCEIKDSSQQKQSNQEEDKSHNLMSIDVRQGTRKGTHADHDPNDIGRVTVRTHHEQQQDDDYF